MGKQLAKMKERLLEGKSQDAEVKERGEEKVPESDDTRSIKSDNNVYRDDLVEVSDEDVAKSVQKAKTKHLEPS